MFVIIAVCGCLIIDRLCNLETELKDELHYYRNIQTEFVDHSDNADMIYTPRIISIFNSSQTRCQISLKVRLLLSNRYRGAFKNSWFYYAVQRVELKKVKCNYIESAFWKWVNIHIVGCLLPTCNPSEGIKLLITFIQSIKVAFFLYTSNTTISCLYS